MKLRAGSLATVLVVLLVAAVDAHQPPRVYRIGVLESAGIPTSPDAFREGLRALGYVEGRNLVIEHRSVAGRRERGRDAARELVRAGVDLIVTWGTAATLAATHVTDTIPIVTVWSGDPGRTGRAAGLILPGANLTGLSSAAPPEVGGERLRLLKELVPGVSRVAVLWNPSDLYSQLLMRETEKAASALGVKLEGVAVRGSWEFERAFEAAVLSPIDALITLESFVTVEYRARIVDFLAMSKLPAMHGLRAFVEAGGLMAYGTEHRDLFRRSATYVHRILNGARPADLPIGQPTKFELVLNRTTARALGLEVPHSLLHRADHVIE